MSDQDEFGSAMRNMGVKQMGEASAEPSPERRTIRRAAGEDKAPKPAAAQPAARDPKLERRIAELEGALTEERDSRAAEQTAWDGERAAWDAERADHLSEVEALQAQYADVQSQSNAAQVQHQVVRLCDQCPRVSGVLMGKVDSPACDACGGGDIDTAVRRFLDACLVNGRLRVLVVGRDEAFHALLRTLVQHSRVKLTQFPVADTGPAARVAVDVAGQDAVVLWGPAAKKVIRGDPERVTEVGLVAVGAMLDAATVALTADLADH
jgi:hypothetical protein